MRARLHVHLHPLMCIHPLAYIQLLHPPTHVHLPTHACIDPLMYVSASAHMLLHPLICLHSRAPIHSCASIRLCALPVHLHPLVYIFDSRRLPVHYMSRWTLLAALACVLGVPAAAVALSVPTAVEATHESGACGDGLKPNGTSAASPVDLGGVSVKARSYLLAVSPVDLGGVSAASRPSLGGKSSGVAPIALAIRRGRRCGEPANKCPMIDAKQGAS